MEDLVKHSANRLKDFLKKMSAKCPLLSIIMSSSNPLKYDQEIVIANQYVSKLSNEASVILFKEHSGEIPPVEIYKLIMM